jgi:hypothetical protein
MASWINSNSDIPREKALYTLASTFEKKNCLSLKLLFGDPQITRPAQMLEPSFTNAWEHLFLPGQIFGIEWKSNGTEFEKFHHLFVLKACGEGEVGVVVPGVTPGAEVLINTSNNINSQRLMSAFKKLQSSGVKLTDIDVEKCRYLNDLIMLKMNADFLVGAIIEHAKNFK